jgi:dipeptidase D
MQSKLQDILTIFEQIAAVPRQSNHEAAISRWMLDWARQHNFPARADALGNVVIAVPATPGLEGAPTVVLQAHLDMVCEKTPDSPHDFARDPIKFVYEGEWLKADRTTLGADDGIGLALALALTTGAAHPPLELLFTVQEEVGIGGATELPADFLTGRTLINLDSEDEGIFIVGCAGGQKTRLRLPLNYAPQPATDQRWRISIGRLQGGHSGVDIHKHRANALKLLARTLYRAWQVAEIRLEALGGGSAHNAIPREAWAVVTCAAGRAADMCAALQAFEQVLRAEFRVGDPEITLAVTPEAGPAGQPLTDADTRRVLYLLLALPHGVAEMSASVAGFVETSNNLAVVKQEAGHLHIQLSQRSTVMSQLAALTARIEAVGWLAGAEVESGEGYPAWEPKMDSPLLARCRTTYRQVFGVDPVVKMIHAGLECGIIGDKYPDMDMISLGATIQNPHSPNERLHLPSVERVWQLLVALLQAS